MRRARKTSGRLLASALGFGVAYYFDTENGASRRKQLQRWLSRTAQRVDSVFDSEAGDPPPVFYPAMRGEPDGRARPDALVAVR
jgi:hypothetical protein